MGVDEGSGDSKTIPRINPHYLTADYAKNFKNILAGNNSEFSKPFPHFSLPNFVENADFVKTLREELTTADWRHKDNDLFSLNETSDISSLDVHAFPTLHKFWLFVRNEMRDWLRGVSGANLNEKIALSSSNYKYTDLLLAHDDQLEGRKYAFILYLTPDWKPEFGGLLNIYHCDDANVPVSLAKAVCPSENTLMMFEVSPRSWHMVTEVLTEKASRLSVHGWYHCDDVVPFRLPPSVPLSKEKPHMDITYDEVMEWINPEYISLDEQKKVQRAFARKSAIDLTNFLQTEKYDATLDELDNCDFEMIGPPSKREVGRLREYALPKNGHVRTLLRLFRSRAMTVLLTQWTGISLHNIRDLSVGDEPEAKKAKLENEKDEEGGAKESVEYISSLNRYGKGCFTMADDELAVEAETNGYCLDVQLFLCRGKWKVDQGGFVAYIAKDEEGEIIRIPPVGNCAALVYREPDVFSFVKYVNDRAKDQCYYVLNCSFFGVDNEASEEGGEGDGQVDNEEEEEEEDSLDDSIPDDEDDPEGDSDEDDPESGDAVEGSVEAESGSVDAEEGDSMTSESEKKDGHNGNGKLDSETATDSHRDPDSR